MEQKSNKWSTIITGDYLKSSHNYLILDLLDSYVVAINLNVIRSYTKVSSETESVRYMYATCHGRGLLNSRSADWWIRKTPLLGGQSERNVLFQSCRKFGFDFTQVIKSKVYAQILNWEWRKWDLVPVNLRFAMWICHDP